MIYSILSRLKVSFLNSIKLFAFGFLLFATSCVTNKKYQMLQKDDANKSNLPSDSVFRKYVVNNFEYKIQTNDIISVRFTSLTPKEYDFLATQPVQGGSSQLIGGPLLLGDLVDDNGEIPFPVVGKAKVAGLTIYEIQEHLQSIANQYLESPIVKVRLLNYRITFLGEMNSEGVVTLNNNRATLLEAIGHAGGLSDLAIRPISS